VSSTKLLAYKLMKLDGLKVPLKEVISTCQALNYLLFSELRGYRKGEIMVTK